MTTINDHKMDFLKFQQNEITEYHIYTKLAGRVKNDHNKKTLLHIAEYEKKHYEFWKKYTGEDIGPRAFSLWIYPILAKVFGLTFAVKLLEKREHALEETYKHLAEEMPELNQILEDEEKHETEIIGMLKDPFLDHMSSIVLGLNDALVELTGALAGFTFAFAKSDIIAVAGFITGIAASFSMAAAEYLSTKSESGDRNPFAAAAFTGFAYLIVVLILIAPYLTMANHYAALAVMLVLALIIIFLFSYYMSVARDLSLRTQVVEMAVISLGAALLTFLVAVLVKMKLGIDV